MLGKSLVAKELLKHGAQPHVQGEWGFTLTYDVLTEDGANVNLQDASGSLPIHLATIESHLHKNSKGPTCLEMVMPSTRPGLRAGSTHSIPP
uniref:Uncharacterized protein n=1 Tax=Callorhinchus milii TaxID=7868 RepID=A0A4W3I1J9_CALMI